MKLNRRDFLSAAAATIAVPYAAQAQTPTWPSRGIALQVGYAAGGVVDFGARVLAEQLKEKVSVPVTVENRPGAAGTIGGNFVAKSTPDGHTLLVAGQPETAMLKSTKAAPPYEVLRDLAPLALLMDYPFLLVVPPSLNVKTWAEFVAYAKSKGDLTYATPGAGTTAHLMSEQVVSASGLKASHVPYQGAAALKPDLIAGRVDFTIDAMPSILPYIRDNQVRAIAITTKERDPKAPEVPTLIELGLLKEEYTGWVGLFAPKATPEAVQKRLTELTLESLKGNGAARIAAADYRPGNPAQKSFADFVRSEEERWGAVFRGAGIKPT